MAITIIIKIIIQKGNLPLSLSGSTGSGLGPGLIFSSILI